MDLKKREFEADTTISIPNKEKDFCRPSQPNDWYDVIATKYNLKRITLHEFRKTHVSLLRNGEYEFRRHYVSCRS